MFVTPKMSLSTSIKNQWFATSFVTIKCLKESPNKTKVPFHNNSTTLIFQEPLLEHASTNVDVVTNKDDKIVAMGTNSDLSNVERDIVHTYEGFVDQRLLAQHDLNDQSMVEEEYVEECVEKNIISDWKDLTHHEELKESTYVSASRHHDSWVGHNASKEEFGEEEVKEVADFERHDFECKSGKQLSKAATPVGQLSHEDANFSHEIGATTLGSINNEVHKKELVDVSCLKGMTALSKFDIPCFVHMITLEEYLLRSHEAYCLRELIIKTKRLPNRKILQFANVWFVLHTTPWSWLVMKNRSALAARNLCYCSRRHLIDQHSWRNNLPSEKIQERAMKTPWKGSGFLGWDSNLVMSHVHKSKKDSGDKKCSMVDIHEWIDKYEGFMVDIWLSYMVVHCIFRFIWVYISFWVGLEFMETHSLDSSLEVESLRALERSSQFVSHLYMVTFILLLCKNMR
ncbi:hypothetical protein SUGI_0010270 [Cryptomeria japonica]|nr:hypothetical protein SUGI_0010270 [Cryptomeria japonica]